MRRKPQDYARRGVSSPIPAWCYICGTSHLWSVACPPVPKYKVQSRHSVSR